MTTREPEWTDQDRAEQLALAQYRAGLCPNGCGQPLTESTTHADHGPDYDAVATTCRACASLLEAKRAVADGKQSNPDAPARLWRIVTLPKG